MQRILITGAFGNIGQSTLAALRGRGGVRVRAFDLDTTANRTAARRHPGVETVWGDLRNLDDVARAVRGMDVVLHIAAIIPPVSDRNPQLARAVNVTGTQNLIQAMEAEAADARLVFASSVSVHGLHGAPTVVGPEAPLKETDVYSGHKIAAEAAVRDAQLRWSILRLGAVPAVAVGQVDPHMFETNLNSPVEFVHTRDVGLAFANAAATPEVDGEILMIGGGEACRMTYREFYERVFPALGIGVLPDAAFSDTPFYTPWMDTARSQSLLAYQHHTLADWIDEMRAVMGWRVPAAKLFRPLARWSILRHSPYWRGKRPQTEAATAQEGSRA